jgi:hypothetical protein
MEFTNINELFADCCLGIENVKQRLDDLDLDESEFKREMNVYFMITLDLLRTELLKMSNYGKWCDSILKYHQKKQIKDINWKKRTNVGWKLSIDEMIGIYHYLIEDTDCNMKISKCTQQLEIVSSFISNKMPVVKFTFADQISKLHGLRPPLKVDTWFEELLRTKCLPHFIQSIVGFAELEPIEGVRNLFIIVIINHEYCGIRIQHDEAQDLLNDRFDKVCGEMVTPIPINTRAKIRKQYFDKLTANARSLVCLSIAHGFNIYRTHYDGVKFEIEKEPFAKYDAWTREIVVR